MSSGAVRLDVSVFDTLVVANVDVASVICGKISSFDVFMLAECTVLLSVGKKTLK